MWIISLNSVNAVALHDQNMKCRKHIKHLTIQVHVCCMKYKTFCCILAPQRRETWLEYLWELTDCCCCKFRWKALEISPSLFMMLWLLGTCCSICTYIILGFVQTGPSIQGFNHIWWMFFTASRWLESATVLHYQGGGSTADSLFLNATNFTQLQEQTNIDSYKLD